jgi:hypothetical protein
MKRLLTATLLLSTLISFGQNVGDHGSLDGVFSFSTVLDMSPIAKNLEKNKGMSEEEKKALLEKQYLTKNYSGALIDDFKTTAYLRYNLYNDQMEFVKNDQIFYMKKEKGRKVRFTTLNQVYKVYELYGDLEFFLVKAEGEKASLLVKQEMRFVEPKKAQSNYAVDKKADFKRNKDQWYIAFGDKVVKAPSKKKEVPAVFGSQSKAIKDYIKKEKLNPKKEADLAKIVNYYNTL